MKTNSHCPTYLFSLFLLFFSLIIPVGSQATEDPGASTISQDILIIQGKIRSYNQTSQILLLKTAKGEKITINLDWKTTMEGYSSPRDIKKGHGVKIWYSVEEKKNRAVKVEKKLDVGC